LTDNEVFFKTTTELARMLRSRKISSVELTQLFLERLKKLGPKYNALAELTPDLALEQARRADQRLRRGGVASPLLGIPYGAKDLLATKISRHAGARRRIVTRYSITTRRRFASWMSQARS
jgi:aspartyl-tRNA(Asn)/glutamyl-tRNA(Gln) amidotransferase subunit A